MSNFQLAKPWVLLSSMLFMCLITEAQIPTGYYSSTDGLDGENLKSALNDIIDEHTEYSYSDLWDLLKVTDADPNNSGNVMGFYSRFSMNAAAEYDGGAGWNREHVWAKSRGDFGTTMGAGTDLHHIRASDVSTNSARNNRNFDEGGSTYVDGSGNYSGTTPCKSGSSWTWEPGDDQKGDVARMIFYMATRYEGENGEEDLELTDVILSNTDNSPLQGRESVLLQWHDDDPVDSEEINRHEAIYSYQNNRNPFIDHPEYVDLIWGDGTAGGGGSGSLSCSSTVSSFPYSQGFESGTGNWSQSSADDFDWSRTSGSTPSSNTGPSGASEGSYYFYIESSSPNYSNLTATIESPCFDLSSQNAATFSFEYHMYGSSSMGGLVLQATTSGTWSTVWSESGNQGTGWLSASVDLASYTGSIVKLRFLGTTGTTWQGDMAIDDLSLSTSGAGTGGGGSTGSTLFISEYIEGSSYNKAIEIGNLTGSSASLSSYSIKKQVNGAGSWGTALSLSGTLADGEVYAIVYSGASSDLTNIADLTTSSTAMSFNGNDPVGLFKDDVLVDIVGAFDGGSSNFAQNTTLVRSSDEASTIYSSGDWDSYGSDTFTYFGGLGTSSGGSTGGGSGSTMPTGYCSSDGNDASYEWLDYVQIGSLVNDSGYDGGYADNTSQTVTLSTGASVSYEMRPGFSGSTYSETYRVWIDFNRDGDFEDSNELVVDEALTTATVSGSFTVPSSVSAGYTRMRVSMKYNGSASTCESFSYGEVEDYQVLLSGSGASRLADSVDALGESGYLEVYPNPATSFVYIKLPAGDLAYEVQMYDVNGREVLRSTVSSLENSSAKLELGSLEKGLYWLTIGDKFKHKIVLE